MTDAEEYELSLYSAVEVLHENEESIVEVVVNSVDEKKYIKKTYFSDKREIYRILSKIKCVNISEVYKVYFEADTIVIEEYIEGCSLHDVLSETGNLDTEKVFKGLIEALIVLQEKDIVHRDIKPSNVMIRKDGTPVLIDFGIARKYSELRKADTVALGTEGYAAPEQFGFAQSDFRTDIFALGKTMETVGDYFNLPPSIKNIVRKCKAFDPDSRYQNALEIKAAITKKRITAMQAALMMATIVAVIVVIIAVRKTGLKNETDNNNTSSVEAKTNQDDYQYDMTDNNQEYKNTGDSALHYGFSGEWRCMDDNLMFWVFEEDGKYEINGDFGVFAPKEIVSSSDNYMCAINYDDEGREHKVEMQMSDDGKIVTVNDYTYRNGKSVTITKIFEKRYEW